uniref:Long neurotoxin-like OH-31 n=1 Tax=Ophiophagus hannah TaxID=8665 RepID=3L231_OPHHA|nr:RecName: Full=Long neurotoxin-like OH-31; Flags: Precursor [Ophiophagus hannah]AAT97253.1 long chain neurotoxin-like protein [Ophiophagus hannah]
MKTLLLTLVVVTILCLDLGLELTNAPDSWSSRRTCLCPAWVPLRSRPVAGHSKQCGSRGRRVDLGCAATCPIVKPGVNINCCSTDNCNPFPKRS